MTYMTETRHYLPVVEHIQEHQEDTCLNYLHCSGIHQEAVCYSLESVGLVIVSHCSSCRCAGAELELIVPFHY